jgi:hypothetical protein
MTTTDRGRRVQLTKQIGEHLVAAELGRRQFIAAPFAGNVPVRPTGSERKWSLDPGSGENQQRSSVVQGANSDGGPRRQQR